MLTYLATIAIVSLAAGRVGYSLTSDELFRPIREWIWKRSPGDGATILLRGDDGDREVPARTMHLGLLVADRFMLGQQPLGGTQVGYYFRPELPPRNPGFFGKLVECPYCMTFWTSLLGCVAWWLLGDDVIYPATPLAAWALANTYAIKGL